MAFSYQKVWIYAHNEKEFPEKTTTIEFDLANNGYGAEKNQVAKIVLCHS